VILSRKIGLFWKLTQISQRARNVYLAKYIKQLEQLNNNQNAELMEVRLSHTVLRTTHAAHSIELKVAAVRGSGVDTGNNLKKLPLRGRKAGLRRNLSSLDTGWSRLRREIKPFALLTQN
jgi:hypothetical protein